jgi:hypothetical protein
MLVALMDLSRLMSVREMFSATSEYNIRGRQVAKFRGAITAGTVV